MQHPPPPPHPTHGPPHGGYPHAPPPPAQEPDKPKDGIPYIGSRISLISKTDIRYEGFLFNIDTRQSMVALQHVRSFGTEGRRPEHIPPSDSVLPYATFKASEIKDLHVCEAAPPMAPPMPPPMAQPMHPYGYPPAPPQPHMAMPPHPPPPPPSAPPMPSAPTPPKQSPAQPSVRSPAKAATPTPPQPQVQQSARPSGPVLLTPGHVSGANKESPRKPQPTQAPQHEEGTTNNNRNSGRTIPGMGGHLLKRKERRVPGDQNNSAPEAANSGEFNFQTGLNEFDKEEEFSKLTVQETKGSYQKSSFFDTISCDALDRLEGNKGRLTASDERRLNTETFGAVGLNNRRSYRGGRGGRGGRRSGGGRGGRGGSGRGGGGGNWSRGRRDGSNSGMPSS
ncbi:TPA: hypothetical protein N0F65_003168 [Lagenidium giganteum]|uniref:Uncharacterized protein n=1 Tax=Lagenidium giganteum TaxID=4803 RepID=A0AAV2ZAR6_9STRA|nr:TPA: hypothetical protein N0F65_003168 [Lagenidium giganteum]